MRNFNAWAGEPYASKRPTDEEMLVMWKAGQRLKVAGYFIKGQKTQAMRFAALLTVRTNIENVERLIALIENQKERGRGRL